MAEEQSLRDRFYEELWALQQKYPMCYIQTWCPDDWQQFLTPERKVDEDDFECNPPADWEEEIHCVIADNLANRFDASQGTDWYSVELAVEYTKPPTEEDE